MSRFRAFGKQRRFIIHLIFSKPIRKDLYMKIGPTIRDYRKTIGILQMDLAGKCKITQTYLSQIENGKKVPTLEVLECLSQELGIPLPLLFFNSLEESEIPENKRDFYLQAKPFIENAFRTLYE